MPNHLANETSPYLRQHKDNPVNWYPWGDSAISQAKELKKPIFLSIGYAACHWCHVMAHESFEDPTIAEILNQNFICIKLDREERPDLDDIYMQAVVLMTGRGGWPMSIFLTPNLQPFYGGTYFPPIPQFNLPSFRQLLFSIIDVWNNKRDNLQHSAEQLTQAMLNQQILPKSSRSFPDLDASTNRLLSDYDWNNGGWGHAPKFPQPMLLEFLIQRSFCGDKNAYHLVEHYLEHLAMGGMFDLVGGGFHRYSTDSRWLIPHFEKMLYDNAQLALAFTHGFALTGNATFKWVAEKTLAFIQREMTHPKGGFYASLDADSPTGEGRFYSWKFKTLKEVLTPDELSWLISVMDLSQEGNFEEGLNVLQLKYPLPALAEKLNQTPSSFIATIEPILNKLHDHRLRRIPPETDDKIITSWNALAVIAFAQASRIFGKSAYIEAAELAIDFLLTNLITEDGFILRSWNQGRSNQPGALEDYAALILALYQVYEINFEAEIYRKMLSFYQKMQTVFLSDGALYDDASQHVPHLILRPRNIQDNATPSGNALACHVHWLLDQLEGFPGHAKNWNTALSQLSEVIQQYPTSFGYWLTVADLVAHPTQQIALISPDNLYDLAPFISQYHQSDNPYKVIAIKTRHEEKTEEGPKLCQNRPTIDGKATAYICQDFTCQLPITELEVFKQTLSAFSPDSQTSTQ